MSDPEAASRLRSAIAATYEANTARVRLTSRHRNGQVAGGWDGVCDFPDHRVYLTERSDRLGVGLDLLLVDGAEYMRDSGADTWVATRGAVAPLDPITHLERLASAPAVAPTSAESADGPSLIVTFKSGRPTAFWPKRPRHAEVSLDTAGRISRVEYVSRPAAVPSVELAFEEFGTNVPVMTAPEATTLRRALFSRRT
jgi:hypothetical protein